MTCPWRQTWFTYASSCFVHALGIVDLYILLDAYECWFADHNLSIFTWRMDIYVSVH